MVAESDHVEVNKELKTMDCTMAKLCYVLAWFEMMNRWGLWGRFVSVQDRILSFWGAFLAG